MYNGLRDLLLHLETGGSSTFVLSCTFNLTKPPHTCIYLYTAQFIVHIRRPGVIALQNVANTDCWLSILEGKTLGTVSQ